MTIDVLITLFVFSVVSASSPGPNNFMLLASGVNFGFYRTIPHILGIVAGLISLISAVGMGLGALLTSFPMLEIALKIFGGAYLAYLAWRIAMTRSLDTDSESARPMTWAEAALFQWVNPKAWIFAVATISIFAVPETPYRSAVILALAYSFSILPVIAIWAAFGVALREWLADPVRLKWFNISMGAALVVSLYPMLA